MTLRELLENVETLAPLPDPERQVAGIAYDSRRVHAGELFFALPGGTHDGRAFARTALAAGAVAVVAAPGAGLDGAPVIEVAEPRRALAMAAANLQRHPSRSLAVVGVTGTNGKTTTTWMLESVFAAVGRRAGVIGTTGVRFAGREQPSTFTTPEAPELQALLREMLDAGMDGVALEVSSHALIQRRTYGLECDVAVFTNLSQDHLDFHGTMDAYLDAKLMLFDGRNGGTRKRGAAVINADDPTAATVIAAAQRGGLRVRRFGEHPEAEVRLDSIAPTPTGLALMLVTEGRMLAFSLPLLGRYNAWNAAAAFAAARALGLPHEAAIAGLERMPGVPGRLERVDAGQPFTVVVDYAHTPDALERALAACREHARERVLLVFGCGGDRDRGKRPLMGAVAARGARRAWVTNDNPRTEDPMAIAREVLAGAPAGALEVELDRRAAIAAALAEARPGDVVLIAGKGHETRQTFGDHVVPFDDREVARELLAAHPPGGRT